jgi:hypothetical protein
MLGSKAIVSLVISKALAAFLDVDNRAVETSLLSPEGRLVLHNTRLKEQKIRVSHQDGVTTFVVLSGTIEEVALVWNWSSSMSLIEDSAFTCRGARLSASFVFEKSPEKEKTEKKEENSSKPQVGFLKREFQRLGRAFTQSIQDSQMLGEMMQNILDTLSIKMSDVEFRMTLPEYGDVTTSTSSEIVAGLGSIEFLSFGRSKDLEKPNDTMRGPLKLQFGVNSLYINLVQERVYPILEPFSYTASIRRVVVMRFTSMGHGYDIVGRESESSELAMRNDDHAGITIHYSPKRLDAIQTIGGMFSGSSCADDGISYSVRRRDSESSALVSKSFYLFLGAAGSVALLGGFISLVGWLRRMGMQGHTFFWIIGASFTVWGLIIVLLLRKWNKALTSAYGAGKTRSNSKEASIIRLPLPFVAVVAPDNIRLTLSKVSILGRLDKRIMNFAASEFNLRCTSSMDGPIVSVSGIRACSKPDLFLLNIDAIDELHIPGAVRLSESLLYTVVRFGKGKLKVKVRSVEAELMSSAPINKSDISELERVAQSLRKAGSKLNAEIHHGMKNFKLGGSKNKDRESVSNIEEEDNRRRIDAEIYCEIKKLKILAMMIEKIPVQKNRQSLRLYAESFRGNAAVDYLMEYKLADTRQEATKILRDVQIEFNLFEHVTRQFKFRDEPDCLYRFVDSRMRRSWDEDSLPYSCTEVDDILTKSPYLPFSLAVDTQEVVLKKGGDGSRILAVRNCQLYAEPGKLAPLVDLTLFAGLVENDVVSLRNARIHALIDLAQPNEIHRFQYSVDSLQASPEYSAEDWYERLGSTTGKDNASKENKQIPFSIPYAYIAGFKLQLSWKGVIFATKESAMNVDPFVGSEGTTSNDLITHFVKHVLGRAPGMLANLRFMGVNVVESTGFGTAMNLGAKFMPFGQYAGVGALALYDGVTGVLDAGKSARHDPNGAYKPGDFIRGVTHAAGATSRAGALRRGKTNEDFYDDDDRVQVDPVDFAFGTASGLAHYTYENKARFAGATIAGATMVAATAVAGPIGCIVVGVLAGAISEWLVNKAEDRLKGSIHGEESVGSSFA